MVAGTPSGATVLLRVAGKAWGHLCIVGSQTELLLAPPSNPPPPPAPGVMVRDGVGAIVCVKSCFVLTPSSESAQMGF